MVRQFTTGFANVHYVASLAQDGIDYAIRFKIEALFEVVTVEMTAAVLTVKSQVGHLGGKGKFLV